MLTRNYYAYRKLMFSGGPSLSGTHPEQIMFYPVDGSYIGSSPIVKHDLTKYGDFGYWLTRAKCTSFPNRYETSASKAGGVFFGSGATPATQYDYKLETPITSGLSIVNPSQYSFNDNGNGQWTFSASYVVTNTTTAEITIREIGIVTAVNTDSSTYYPVLMERTVLDEPITIPAGDAKLITVKLTQNVG